MVKIIQGFRRPSPIAEGVRNAAQSLFGDRLTPALKQAQLDKAQQEMALTEREANASRAFAEGLNDPLVGNAAIGGIDGQDAADFNRLRAAREAAESGGDLLGNVDLNAAMMGAGQSADDTGLGMREGLQNDFRRTKYSSDASAGARVRSAEIAAAQRAAANQAALAAEAEARNNELVSVVDQQGNTRLVPRGNVNFQHQPAPDDLDQAQAFEFERLRRGDGLENASLFRREAVGAAPNNSQIEGELLLQNFENLGGLGPRQAESLGALPTPPSETQVRAGILERALEETGFDPSTVPEDMVMSAAGFEEPGSDDAKVRQINRLVMTGVPRDTAIGIVDGRYTVSRDPITGSAQVLDKATGSVVGGLTDDAVDQIEDAALQESAAPDMDVQNEAPDPDGAQGAAPDFAGAFGAEGVLKNVANTASDFTGFGQVFPESAEGKRKLNNLNVETTTTLAGLANVRGGKYLVDAYENILAKSGGIQGPEDAFNVLKEMRNLVARARDTAEQIAQSNVSPSEQSNANMTIERLDALLPQYDQILDQFDEQMQGGAGDLPQVSSDDEYDALPPGTEYMDPEGNVRRKQ